MYVTILPVNSLLFRITLSGILSIGALLVILFRVSPLLSPTIALPFFFATLFLAITSVTTLICYGVWGFIPIEGLDMGRKLTISLREGIFFGIATLCLVLFHILGILTWWVGALIYAVFMFVEMALQA